MKALKPLQLPVDFKTLRGVLFILFAAWVGYGDLIGNIPSSRINASDGSEGVFYTSYVPIFFNLGAAGTSIPSPGDGQTITIKTSSGSSTLGAFPIRTDLNRDYAYSVKFTAIPEPSSALFVIFGAMLLRCRTFLRKA